ncbi:hypothetical protein ACFW34_24990 [Streptomyces sp. NPDC058848]|uniref:hypothetical protein n=1 Tax=unclassified Streptomyces TaxID=2593676 RepID=UPI0036AAA294
MQTTMYCTNSSQKSIPNSEEKSVDIAAQLNQKAELRRVAVDDERGVVFSRQEPVLATPTLIMAARVAVASALVYTARR